VPKMLSMDCEPGDGSGVDDSVSAQWQTTSVPAVDPVMFGKDHWSTFAYVETRCVDYKGVLDGDHMRCHGARHPMLAGAGRRAGVIGGADGAPYPTRLKRAGDGSPVELSDHDDYDCIDDLIACGLVSVEMPKADLEADCFIDVRGRCIVIDGEKLSPYMLTGMGEGLLARFAHFSLTDRGVVVAGQLRAHKAGGGNFAGFVVDSDGTGS
jgi:hypothetical protein